MTKLPYGGFELNSDSEGASPWQKLETIRKKLENGDVVPPYLASWLGLAIERSAEDPKKLLRELGIAKKPGRARTIHTEEEAWEFGKMLYELVENGVKPETALTTILSEFFKNGNEPSRSQLQKWRDNYHSAVIEDARLQREVLEGRR